MLPRLVSGQHIAVVKMTMKKLAAYEVHRYISLLPHCFNVAINVLQLCFAAPVMGRVMLYLYCCGVVVVLLLSRGSFSGYMVHLTVRTRVSFLLLLFPARMACSSTPWPEKK